MRLKQIKLAGFKSFVDPTVVPFPQNLTAIVGPNGCGKSNLIDAVRWVMGESSAKHLRGDSMTDVIFNGSTARKPVGQASIELVFDNCEGRVIGELANFSEISIRRMVTREGQSNYFLNGARCRRKDITDVFLGTGLGPRSYAIIEQGMISRLIESKPQELRVFIEEAAGISKYKERRRETENRIRHTRENLERLEDIREELGKQLSHLQRQATSAMKYKEFKAEERELKAQLSALRWQRFHNQVGEYEQLIGQLETELESRIADQRGADADIERSRELHIELSDQFNEVQGRFYGIGADIARLEQAIKHQKERKVQLVEDIRNVSESLHQIGDQKENDQSRLEELQQELMEAEPELEMHNESFEASQEELMQLEEYMLDWQSQWDSFNQESSKNNQQLEVEKTRLQHLESHISRMVSRLENTERELAGLESDSMEASMMEASEALSLAEEETAALAEMVEELVEQISGLREQQREKSRTIDETRKEVQKMQGRKVSLEALQKAALGRSNKVASQWLEQKGLKSNQRLVEKMSVESGWETAVETVLGDTLQAVLVDDVELLADLNELSEGELSFLQKNTNGELVADSLASKVTAPVDLGGILGKVKMADDLASAMSMRSQLASDESVVTRDGIWLGKEWIRVSRKAENEAGLVEREAELKELSAQLEEKELWLEEREEEAEALKEKTRQQENAWEQKQRELRDANKVYSELRAKVGSQQAKLDQTRQRMEKLRREQSEVQQQIQTDETNVTKSRMLIGELVESMAGDLEKKEELSSMREEKRNRLEQARSRSREAKDVAHKLALRVESLKTQINSTQVNFQRMHDQVAQLQQRKATLEDNLAGVSEPTDDLQIDLEDALEKRLLVEEELKAAREKLSEADNQMRVLDKKRAEAEQAAQVIRSRLERSRMEWQECKTRQNTQAESLVEEEHAVEELVAGLPEDANEDEWQKRLEQIATRIQRLGAINLAAIDEHKQQEERKVYLDTQHEDLTGALETLENAIRKIDRETRTRFKETFDKINSGLKELFPKVFGGGHAYLELTGEDLLDTGVAVMARPPGKRNSTIHLLSGGEKALTAIALVFSIFQLNPSPFCMLDEVDAPLDDANVGRFCNIVKEMSEKVQFIYISHNKVAMEMAHQLAGVTMQEPGVSRLVAVDIEEAAALASQ
ncbi:chromosome segregation protein SMC [Pleionea sp. CnH1-48]|uniref:chromosome segregation protein SMC n=1 Tax=Pleionea sp. CnH1-48 TaxID=2954494 RepID=UPI0020980CA8|nr:chromosome segregation protein SMC [Pleionea sp. CnH1-48]MCO7226829.1 chromosome segregation protein SMC [Pleionea sp. CnH1-48]